MKALFFGDSLTRGQVGSSFIKLLAKKYPRSQLVNGGTNGDTVNIIAQKLLAHLQKKNDYDFLVLQGGGNDILLPFFKERGGLFGFAYKSQLKKGLVPLQTAEEYQEALADLFKKIKLVFSGKVIFITMTCLNEQLDNSLNSKRAVFNAAARKAAAEYDIALADVEPEFENILRTKPQADYLIESFWAVTITDRMASLSNKGIERLSQKRNLHLTIDGAHINTRGAAIISDSVGRIIDEIIAANKKVLMPAKA